MAEMTARQKHDMLLARQTQRIHDYIDTFISSTTKICVIQITLGYKDCKVGGFNREELCDKYSIVKKDRVNLFNRIRRDKRFSNISLCYWKLRYNIVRGFYYQMFFFYTDVDFENVEIISSELTECWSKTTSVRGRMYNNVFSHGNTWIFNSNNVSVSSNLKRRISDVASVNDTQKLIIPNYKPFGRADLRSGGIND